MNLRENKRQVTWERLEKGKGDKKIIQLYLNLKNKNKFKKDQCLRHISRQKRLAKSGIYVILVFKGILYLRLCMCLCFCLWEYIDTKDN